MKKSTIKKSKDMSHGLKMLAYDLHYLITSSKFDQAGKYTGNFILNNIQYITKSDIFDKYYGNIKIEHKYTPLLYLLILTRASASLELIIRTFKVGVEDFMDIMCGNTYLYHILNKNLSQCAHEIDFNTKNGIQPIHMLGKKIQYKTLQTTLYWDDPGMCKLINSISKNYLLKNNIKENYQQELKKVWNLGNEKYLINRFKTHNLYDIDEKMLIEHKLHKRIILEPKNDQLCLNCYRNKIYKFRRPAIKYYIYNDTRNKCRCLDRIRPGCCLKCIMDSELCNECDKYTPTRKMFNVYHPASQNIRGYHAVCAWCYVNKDEIASKYTPLQYKLSIGY